MRVEFADRWKALRNWASYSQDVNWLWIVLALGICALLAAAVLTGFFSRKPAARRSVPETFGAQARSLGLSDAEQTVLASIASRAELKNVQAIFTMEDAVNQGARDLLAEESAGESSLPDRERLEAAVASICRKLGFQPPAASQSVSVFGTRHVPQGARMLIVDEDGTVRLAATVAGSDSQYLILVADTDLNLAPPVHVLLRYGSEGMAREFDCELVYCEGRQFRARHAQAVRTMNLRRYVRVPVDQDALVAEWPFLQDGRDMRIPFFVQARLQEIAGPGLLLQMPTRGALGERLLVIARLADRSVAQGVAAVRRVSRLEGGKSLVAVEYLDLGPQDLAEMVRQTNLASHADRPGESTPPPRAMRATGAAVPQELK
jgi:hypothetical protein